MLKIGSGNPNRATPHDICSQLKVACSLPASEGADLGSPFAEWPSPAPNATFPLCKVPAISQRKSTHTPLRPKVIAAREPNARNNLKNAARTPPLPLFHTQVSPNQSQPARGKVTILNFRKNSTEVLLFFLSTFLSSPRH